MPYAKIVPDCTHLGSARKAGKEVASKLVAMIVCVHSCSFASKWKTQNVSPNVPKRAPDPGKVPKFSSFTHEARFQANGRHNTFPLNEAK